MSRLRPFLLLAVLSSVGATSAFADTLFNFSFTGSTFSGSGVFDTVSQGSGMYLVQSVTGSVDTGNGTGRTIAGVLPLDTFEDNDNLVYFPSMRNMTYFDSEGVSFALDNGAEVNLFSNSGAYLKRSNGNLVSEVAAISVTPATAPVPEPGSLALLGTGVLAAAGAIRRRLSA